ncbi:MAG: HEAT repeat domain-containing protein [Myxococcota bacterium]
MDSSTGSELIVLLAWRSAEVAALSAALMLTIALIVRQYLRRELRVQARVVATWRPLLTRIAIGDDEIPPLPALPHAHRHFLMEEWNALHGCVRGEAAERLNALAPRLGLDLAARRGVHSRKVGERILAIRTLGALRDASTWPALQEQLVSRNALVSFYSAAALVSIDAQRAMPGIMLQLAERESWPGEAMARLLVDAGADIAREPIRALMLSLNIKKVPPLLPWLAHVDAVLGSEVAIELLHRHPDRDEIVASALNVILDPVVLPEFEHFANAKDADVRKNLAVACGRLGGLGEVKLLLWLLADPVWWVRYRAAQALLKLKGMDRDKLAEIRGSLSDPFARDMLAHATAEAALS